MTTTTTIIIIIFFFMLMLHPLLMVRVIPAAAAADAKLNLLGIFLTRAEGRKKEAILLVYSLISKRSSDFGPLSMKAGLALVKENLFR